MRNSEVVVDGVAALTGGAHAVGTREKPEAAAIGGAGRAERVTVRFAGGQSGLLDTSDFRGRIWADVLTSLRESGQPAYVQIDPRTRAITELLLPKQDKVREVRPAEDGRAGLEVDLTISHAVYSLRPDNPDFDDLAKALRKAEKSGTPVLVTARDDHEIVDLRPADAEPKARRAPRKPK
jgi:hypothetical protein